MGVLGTGEAGSRVWHEACAVPAMDDEPMAQPSGPCRVILLGMMGSGKTTVGTALAHRLGWRYHDNDALLARATGRTARELALGSRTALRDAEAAALRLAVREPEPSIVAAAAGVVLDPALRAELQGAGIIAWLHAPPHVLAGRAARGTHRPWLSDDAIGWMRSAAAEREPLYRQVATLEVDTSGAGVGDAVGRLLAELVARGCVDDARPALDEIMRSGDDVETTEAGR